VVFITYHLPPFYPTPPVFEATDAGTVKTHSGCLKVLQLPPFPLTSQPLPKRSHRKITVQPIQTKTDLFQMDI
jgi:hypothetical protein